MKKMYTIIVLGFLLLSVSCSNEPIDSNLLITKANPSDVIKKDSELFINLIRVSTSEDDSDGNGEDDSPNDLITCIDFMYPFKIFIYNESYVQIDEKILQNDTQFQNLLTNLTDNQSISISYPLQTTLDDGTIFSVNSNEDLLIAIYNCSQDEVVLECNALFCSNSSAITCYWKIPLVEYFNNDFAGAVLEPKNDGSLKLYHLNQNYVGTWQFLYIDNKLFLNIFIEGTSNTSSEWNFNFRVESVTNSRLVLKTPLKSRELVNYCSIVEEYAVGEIGPTNGLVVYDKGFYENGWRYIEMAANDIEKEEWGCIETLLENTDFSEIGTGLQNTYSILKYHNNLTNYYGNPYICSSSNNGSLTAKTAIETSINDVDVWFIPSLEELQLIYTNLHANNLGNLLNETYWSSTQNSVIEAKCINFDNGSEINANKNNHTINTRTIRYF